MIDWIKVGAYAFGAVFWSIVIQGYRSGRWSLALFCIGLLFVAAVYGLLRCINSKRGI